MRLSRLWLNVIIAAGFLILPLLVFGDVTLAGNTMLPADNLFQWLPWRAQASALGVGQPQNHLISDLILQNYAWKTFVRESLAAGEIPLWNPHLFAGVPFLAAGQHGAYYPFGLVFLALPLTWAYGWYTVGQLWLAGLAAYIFARVLGQRRQSAFLAGLVFQGCGFMLVSAAVFPMILGAAAWLPLLLAALEMVIRRSADAGSAGRTLPWAVGGAIALGFQVLAGHIEITYYTLLVLGTYAVWRLLPALIRLWRLGPGRRAARLLRPLGWVAGTIALGLMLGAVQFIPFYEVGQTNFREGAASLDEIRGWAFPPRRALTLALPNFFGNPSHHAYRDAFSLERVPFTVNSAGVPNPRGPGTSDWGIKNYVEGGIYLGILPLFLATLGLWSARARRAARGQILFLAVLALLSLAFIFGTPLYALLYYGLPGINQLHSPFRWVFPLSVAVALLAGFGADWLATAPGDAVARRLLVGVSGLAGAALLAGAAGSRLLYPSLETAIERLFRGLALAPEAFADARAFYGYTLWQLVALAGLLLAAALVLWLGRRPRRLAGAPVWFWAAVLLIGVDLGLASGGFHAAVDPALLAHRPALLDYLSAQPGAWRFTTFDPRGDKPLNANAAWPYGLHDVRGYESVIPRQYTDYMGAIEPQEELPFNRVQPVRSLAALDSPLLDLLGVRYVITPEQIDLPKYALEWEGEGLRVYRNLAEVPRAYTLPASATLVTPDPLAAMRQADPRRFVLVEARTWARAGMTQAEAAPTAGTLVPATLVAAGNVEVVARAAVAERAWLVLNDSHAPGWDAYVSPVGRDGSAGPETRVAVWRVNQNFRGVRLEPGAWQVRFRYSPLSFKVGGLTSFMGGIILLFGLVIWGWRQFFPRERDLGLTRTLAKNSLAPMVLNLFNRAIDFVFAAFYLRLLGPGDAGGYATAITIASLYEIVANWGLNTLIIREVSQDRSQASRYLFNTSLLRVGTGLVAALPIGVYVGYRALSPTPLDAPTQIAIGLLMLGMIFSGMGQGLSGLFYAFEEAETPAAIATVTTILRVGFGVAVLLLGWGFVGLAGVSIVVNVLTLVILAGLALRRFPLTGPWRVEADLQRQMLSASYPLMLNHLLATIYFFLDVPLLQQFKGDEAVGWYDSAYKYVKAFNIIPSFFTIALFPVISRQVRESPREARFSFRLSVRLLVLVAVPLAALTTLLADVLIGILGGGAFLPDGAIALRFLIWSIPFGWINSVTNYVLIALGQERRLTWAFIVGVAFNLITNLIFIPLYSYQAAAITTILSEIILLAAFALILSRRMPDVRWGQMLWKPVVAGALMGGAIWLGNLAAVWVGLAAGLFVYPVAVWRLGVFSGQERRVLAELLPASVAARLGLAHRNEPAP